MIHSLLVIAVILFIVWLLLHASMGIVNIVWLAIFLLIGLWLLSMVRRRRSNR